MEKSDKNVIGGGTNLNMPLKDDATQMAKGQVQDGKASSQPHPISVNHLLSPSHLKKLNGLGQGKVDPTGMRNSHTSPV